MDQQIKKPSHNSQKLLDISLDKIKKIVWFLGKHAFLVILLFILLNVLFGEYLLYEYVFPVTTKEPEVINAPVIFLENKYTSILKQEKDKEAMFKAPFEEKYANPFQ